MAIDWSVIGLGGNVGGMAAVASRFAEVQQRLEAMTGAATMRSSLYRSEPRGPIRNQEDFLNAVIALPWQPDDPRALLAALHAIEQQHRRSRAVEQGPRTLDLDVLVIGRRLVHEPGLVVPHPGLAERRFVLEPLAEVVGVEFELPDGRRLDALLADPQIAAQSVVRL